ncbi:MULTISPECIES: hypothetical protein [unclassified Paenibacillus]|uniref:hypothetical protein n=1 Tax=unclassified Paenibacillus TaxID=185978 RepID=UPI0027849907|nr:MULTISPECIES: hypothetical protein [unclassified Paenibacillus]MDQ0896189.1 hypothetical protein [Paenibacillus sp. V4I7]MDQ0913995.1 hypothetical protein [Paenibacillus sp. V4I5]
MKIIKKILIFSCLVCLIAGCQRVESKMENSNKSNVEITSTPSPSAILKPEKILEPRDRAALKVIQLLIDGDIKTLERYNRIKKIWVTNDSLAKVKDIDVSKLDFLWKQAEDGDKSGDHKNWIVDIQYDGKHFDTFYFAVTTPGGNYIPSQLVFADAIKSELATPEKTANFVLTLIKENKIDMLDQLAGFKTNIQSTAVQELASQDFSKYTFVSEKISVQNRMEEYWEVKVFYEGKQTDTLRVVHQFDIYLPYFQ